MEDNNEYFERNQFTFYLSFEKAISMLQENEQLKLYRGISRYSLFGEEPEEMPESLSDKGQLAWMIIFPLIKSARSKAKSGKGNKGNPGSNNNPLGRNQHEVKREVKREVKEGKGKGKGKDKDKDITLSNESVSESAHTHTEEDEDLESYRGGYEIFLDFIKKDTPYIAENLTAPTLRQFVILKRTIGSQKIVEICRGIENRADLRCKYTNLFTTIGNWIEREDKG